MNGHQTHGAADECCWDANQMLLATGGPCNMCGYTYIWGSFIVQTNKGSYVYISAIQTGETGMV